MWCFNQLLVAVVPFEETDNITVLILNLIRMKLKIEEVGHAWHHGTFYHHVPMSMPRADIPSQPQQSLSQISPPWHPTQTVPISHRYQEK